jgi:tripartite-type tricarboxylate transporter receptor subunit TctC
MRQLGEPARGVERFGKVEVDNLHRLPVDGPWITGSRFVSRRRRRVEFSYWATRYRRRNVLCERAKWQIVGRASALPTPDKSRTRLPIGGGMEAPLSLIRCLSGFLAAIAALTVSPASAQDYPNRPIRVVVAFPAGGPTDFVARLLGDKLKDTFGQVIVENKPGANGAIGADSVAKAAPDGHTLFMTTVGAVAITPHMRANLPYDTLRDFAPVTLVVRNTTTLVVRADSPVNSVKEFVALAKSKDGNFPFATTGVGSTTHLATELFASAAGFKFVHVPYRGAAPALTDLLGGQVQAFFADVPVLMPQINGGKVKPLAAASGQRNPMLPNVPTLAESGYPDTTSDNWYGLLAPAKTPPAVIAKLNAAFVAAINDPVVKDKLIKSGAIPVANTPEQFGAFLKEELARWGKLVRAKGIKEPG